MPSTDRAAPSVALPRIRGERLIATGRLVLAGFSLLAVRLEPTVPARNAAVIYVLLGVLLAYALVLAAVAWLSTAPPQRLELPVHVADLGLFTLLVFFSEGTGSPFFVYFTFALVAATLRWRWRGALWTALAALLAFNASVFQLAFIAHDPAFELNRYIIRTVSLAVLGGLLVYVGSYEGRLFAEVGGLAAWPRAVTAEPETVVAGVLDAAARSLDVPRTLLLWEDPDEPWVDITLRAGGRLQTWRDDLGGAYPWVAEPLAEVSFVCPDVTAAAPVSLWLGDDRLHQWRGAPLHQDLQQRFDVHAVLCLRLKGSLLDARLLALDRSGMTADDLFFGEAVARQATASLDHVLLLRRVREGATAEERVRLSRDLHDGLLQALGGTALKLKALEPQLAQSPEAQRQLAGIRQLLSDEQRDLRLFVEELAPLGALAEGGPPGFEALIGELVRRIERGWEVRVDLHLAPGTAAIAPPVAREIGHIVREALANAARHGRASAVRLDIEPQDGALLVVVADNGRGFGFRGRLTHAELVARQLGPVRLRERVSALGGTLDIDSTDAGARLDIRLPLSRPPSRS